MKRFLFSLCASFLMLSASAISLNGVEFTIDTLSMYSAGPGTMFYELRMLKVVDETYRLDCWLMTVDTRNPYVSVEQVLGQGQVKGVERPSNMAKRSTTDTKIFFGGVNGDFYANSTPVGTTIVNGEYALTPWGAGGGRRHGGVDADKKGVTAFTHTYSMQLITPTNDTLIINHANGTRGENELVLYNHYLGKNTATNAYGTELQIQLLENEKWATTGTMKAKVLKKQENVGSMSLDAMSAVLSGHGTMATALSALNEGDEITLNFELKLDGEPINVAQMIGGDHYNTMILDSGVVATKDFWDELHPRTGFGVSQTRDTILLLVVDGRGVSKGCTTKVLAEILKYYGAYSAVNWDGGGSSCMYVRPFDQVNRGSDGSERTVTNGMFVVANLPQVDSMIVSIKPYTPTYVMPRYAVIAPKFLGYNQYGVLIDADVQGVQLSCDASLGEILPDGRFLSSGTQSGVLKATLGELSTEMEISMNPAPIHFRLDSVLCGPSNPYKVEVQAIVNDKPIDLYAEALAWTSLDPAIAAVDEVGVVTGLTTGTTYIIGQIDDFKDTITVKVEMPSATTIIWDDFHDYASWQLSGTTGFNPALTSVDNSSNVNLNFTYKVGRGGTNVQAKKDSVIYSCPEKLQIPMFTDAVVSEVIVMLRANNALENRHISFKNIPTNEQYTIEIVLADEFGDDAAIWPLHFEGIIWYLDRSTETGPRYITLQGVWEVFEEGVDSKVEIVATNEIVTKYIEQDGLYIQHKGYKYNVLGATIK